MSNRSTLPVKTRGGNQIPLQVNDVLTHPMFGIDSAQKWKYRYLRTVKVSTPDRPDSGRIFVENVVTGKRGEFYAFLFGISFKEI